jgi:hypothetical protein
MLNASRPPRASPQARGETEELIADPRGALTPAEVVEHKLTALLSHCGLGISHMLACRRSSRDLGPASSLADGAAAHDTHGTDAANHQRDSSDGQKDDPMSCDVDESAGVIFAMSRTPKSSS